ncbi:MAG: hypothetical protein JO102_05395 [Elusimicrobia bacterium]|nr:hypothetical protein [Elusimicrobiota bacterium]
MSKRVAEILSHLPVEDLTVEEMPLEDVIRHIFAQGSVEAPAPNGKI